MKTSEIQQNTSEWLAMRRDYIGGSDAPIIMGVSPWRTPYQLWQDKLGLGKQQEETAAMAFGKGMESGILEAFCSRTGRDLRPCVVYHPSIEFMMASLDGIADDGSFAIEIKTANEADHDLAKNGLIPEKYYPQLQHQLLCTGLSSMVYHSWHKSDWADVVVYADEEYQQILIEREKEFWDRVLTMNPPALVDRDRVEIKDVSAVKLSEEYSRVKAHVDQLELALEDIRKCLIRSAEGRNARCGSLLITKVETAGRINYAAIPELQGVDLTQYRKPTTTSWRIS
jgi:putative phage-type endonuclease